MNTDYEPHAYKPSFTDPTLRAVATPSTPVYTLEEIESFAYEALLNGREPVECPGCDGHGDDIRHEGWCSLCSGAGELSFHRLLDVANEIDRLRADEAVPA